MGTVTADITMTLNGYVQGLVQGTEVVPGDDQLRCSSDSLWKWAFEHAEVHGEELRTAVSAGAFLMSSESEKHFGDELWGQVVDLFSGSTAAHPPVFVVASHPALTQVLTQAQEAAGEAPVSVIGDTALTEELIAAHALDELRIHLPGVFRSGGSRLEIPEGAPIGRRASVRGNEFVTHLTYTLNEGRRENRPPPGSLPGLQCLDGGQRRSGAS